MFSYRNAQRSVNKNLKGSEQFPLSNSFAKLKKSRLSPGAILNLKSLKPVQQLEEMKVNANNAILVRVF